MSVVELPAITPRPPVRSAHPACCRTCSGSAATPNARRAWPGCSTSRGSAITNSVTGRTCRAANASRYLLAALGRITGTDTRASGDDAEMIAVAPTTLWALTADRHRAGSLAQSVERLGLAARAVRDQMSNDTWMVLAAVDRAVMRPSAAPPDSHTEGESYLGTAHSQTLAGMLALSGWRRSRWCTTSAGR